MSGGQASEALERLIREYGDRAFQFAFRLSGNVEESKDLVQDAFFRVLRSWGSYDAARSLDAWFFRILRNVFLDARKKYETLHGVSLDAGPAGVAEEDLTYGDLLPDGEAAFLDALERSESIEKVQRTLAALSYEHRVVLSLCDMDGLNYEEISKVLDIPIGTVRSRVSRARIAFKRRLAVRLGGRG
ncbi:MAG: hypothetical protein A2X36_06570 [Elusimicrobia bacterium GWA2_69_24]|nr:MAG: hypothetical protein A2X36_06570 [Elusimicrobia bacterium GWA2_69_24]